MPTRFAYRSTPVFSASFSLATPGFLTTSAVHQGGIPHWVLVAGAIFFTASLAVTVVLLVKLSRRDPDKSKKGDPWPSWNHHDGKDAAEAAAERERVDQEAAKAIKEMWPEHSDWVATMTQPAPPIVATPTDPAVVETWFAKAWQ